MKKEVAFFKDKRGGFSAKNLIALYRSLGYTDAQIKDEMLKIRAAQQSVHPTVATVAAQEVESTTRNSG